MRWHKMPKPTTDVSALQKQIVTLTDEKIALQAQLDAANAKIAAAKIAVQAIKDALA